MRPNGVFDGEGVNSVQVFLSYRRTAAIDRALTDCDAVLAVIGPGWLTASTPDGRQRLGDPDDYVRIELSRALQRDDLRVIPVLVGGARLPAAEALPVELQGLVERQGIVLRDESWHQDVETLVRSLRGEPALPTRRRRPWLVAGVAAIAVAVLSGLAWWIWTPGGDDAGGIPPSEEALTGCPAPNDDDWHSIQLGDDLTGTVETTNGPLIFTVKDAHWRAYENSGQWQVVLDTEMENGRAQDTEAIQHGSWHYPSLIVAQRQFQLDASDNCFSAEPAFVEPGLKGDARAGFVVTCMPEGAIELVTHNADLGEVPDNANINVTPDTEPGEC